METILKQSGIEYRKRQGVPNDSWRSTEFDVKEDEVRVIDNVIHYVSMILTTPRRFRKPIQEVYWRKYKSPEYYDLQRYKEQVNNSLLHLSMAIENLKDKK